MRKSWNDEDLKKAVPHALSIAEVCRQIGIKPVGGNYKTVKAAICRLDVNTDHFLGRDTNSGERWKGGQTPKPLSEILVQGSNFNSSHLRVRLLREGIFDHRCSKCSNETWLNSPIALELEHVNGINTDNRIENLTLLCPNCHAQTETYRGRNKKS